MLVKLTFLEYTKRKDIEKMAKKVNLNISKFDSSELMMGIDVEKEHDGKMGKDIDVIKNDQDVLKIAIAHLREDPKYYTKLKKVEEE